MLDEHIAQLVELTIMEANITHRISAVTRSLCGLRDEGTITQMDVNQVFWTAQERARDIALQELVTAN